MGTVDVDLKCPNCGGDLSEDAVFCEACGKVVQKKTIYPLTAGILAIIGSCLSIAMGILALTVAWMEININRFNAQIDPHAPALNPYPSYLITMGLFAVVAFAFGLFGAIASINRRFLLPAVVGLSLLTASGALISIPFNGSTTWEAGVPLTVLAVASIVMVAKSKLEFK